MPADPGVCAPTYPVFPLGFAATFVIPAAGAAWSSRLLFSQVKRVPVRRDFRSAELHLFHSKCSSDSNRCGGGSVICCSACSNPNRNQELPPARTCQKLPLLIVGTTDDGSSPDPPSSAHASAGLPENINMRLSLAGIGCGHLHSPSP